MTLSCSCLRNRVFFASAIVAMIIALRVVFVSDPVIGMLISYVAVLVCLAYFWRLIDRTLSMRRDAYSDSDGIE